MPSDYYHTGPATRAALSGEWPDRSHVQYTQADIPVYWQLARQYGLGDDFFSSVASSSTPNHIAMITGQTGGDDFTTSASPNGCLGPPNLIELSREMVSGQAYGAFPCFDVPSLPAELSTGGVTWRYYASNTGWNAPLFVHGLPSSGKTAQFLNDLRSGQLRQVSWVTPTAGATDHPPAQFGPGEAFVHRSPMRSRLAATGQTRLYLSHGMTGAGFTITSHRPSLTGSGSALECRCS